jgi:hypothetical protein
MKTREIENDDLMGKREVRRQRRFRRDGTLRRRLDNENPGDGGGVRGNDNGEQGSLGHDEMGPHRRLSVRASGSDGLYHNIARFNSKARRKRNHRLFLQKKER